MHPLRKGGLRNEARRDEMKRNESKSKRKEELEKRSAIYWTDKLSDHTAQLILCGTNDKHVHYQQAIDIAEALKAENKPYKLVVYEGDNHGLQNHREEVRQLIGSWLKEHVSN